MRLFGFYALIAVAVAGYSGYWFILADRAEAVIDARAAAWHDDGLVLSYDERRVHGYPYRLSSEFKGFALEKAGDGAGDGADDAASGAWRWHGEQLTIHGEPWNLRHYIAVLTGTNRIEWESPIGLLRFDAIAEAARASVILDDRYRADQASVEVRGLEVRPVDGTTTLTAALIQIHARRPETDPAALDAALLIERLVLPTGSGGALGDEIARLSFDGTASGPVPRRFEPGALVAWRDNGGVIDTHDFTLDWGPVRIEADGALTLDAALRPQGAFTARIVGHDVLIEILRAEGTISKDVANVLRFTFALLSVRPDDNGPPVLTIPITIQDGWLSAGPVPVLRVHPVAKFD